MCFGYRSQFMHYAEYSYSSEYRYFLFENGYLFLWVILVYYLFQNCLALHPTCFLCSLYKTPVIWILDQSCNFLSFSSLSYFLYFSSIIWEISLSLFCNLSVETFIATTIFKKSLFWGLLFFYKVIFLLYV